MTSALWFAFAIALGTLTADLVRWFVRARALNWTWCRHENREGV